MTYTSEQIGVHVEAHMATLMLLSQSDGFVITNPSAFAYGAAKQLIVNIASSVPGATNYLEDIGVIVKEEAA